MINDINLLPDKILYRNRRIMLLAVKILGIVIVAFFLVYGALFIKFKRMGLEKQIAEITSSLDGNALKALTDAENKLSQKQDEKKELDEAIKEVPADGVKLTELISRVSDLMPKAIKSDSINYKGDSGQMELTVTADSREDISLFLKRLYDDKTFINIGISPISGTDSPYRLNVTLGLKETDEKTTKQ